MGSGQSCTSGPKTVSSAPVRANKEETNPARVAHVPSVVSSHARADLDVPCSCSTVSGPSFDCADHGSDSVVNETHHSAEAHAAITAELVACTLGHRVRPELRVDRVGRFAHLVNQGVLHLKEGARALMDELATYRYPTR